MYYDLKYMYYDLLYMYWDLITFIKTCNTVLGSVIRYYNL